MTHKLIEKEVLSLYEAAKLHPLYCQPKVSSVVLYRGNVEVEPDFLFIGEAPGFEENEAGVPFVGKSGKILQKWIEDMNLQSYMIINAVPIIPLDSVGKIRKPSTNEIDYFRPYTLNLISVIKPKNIVVIGRSAQQFLTSTFLKNTEWKTALTNLGKKELGFIYHPSYYMRNGRDGLDDFRILMENRI